MDLTSWAGTSLMLSRHKNDLLIGLPVPRLLFLSPPPLSFRWTQVDSGGLLLFCFYCLAIGTTESFSK